MKKPFYNVISTLMAALGILTIILVIKELPQNDSVHGNYINMLLKFSSPNTGGIPEMKASAVFPITEARILSMLYVCSILFSAISIVTGLVARSRGEETIGHAAPIALSVVLLALSFQYRWILAW